QSASDHFYTMAADYAANNVVFVQTNTLNGPVPVTLASPGSYAALSFLCAAANGQVTNRCIIQHLDGGNEVANVRILDWATNVSVLPAWTANSVINISDRTITNANGGTP